MRLGLQPMSVPAVYAALTPVIKLIPPPHLHLLLCFCGENNAAALAAHGAYTSSVLRYFAPVVELTAPAVCYVALSPVEEYISPAPAATQHQHQLRVTLTFQGMSYLHLSMSPIRLRLQRTQCVPLRPWRTPQFLTLHLRPLRIHGPGAIRGRSTDTRR